MDFITSIKTCFIKYVDFQGRASRPEFWYFQIFDVLILICADIVDAQIAGHSYWSHDGSGLISSIIFLLSFPPLLSVGARRLHDIGKSGWWQLLYFTIVGIIPLFIWFASSTDSKGNKYDSPVTINSKWIKFLLIPLTTSLVGVSCSLRRCRQLE